MLCINTRLYSTHRAYGNTAHAGGSAGIVYHTIPLLTSGTVCAMVGAVEQYLQGGVEFPTGGDSPRALRR